MPRDMQYYLQNKKEENVRSRFLYTVEPLIRQHTTGPYLD